MKPVNLPKVLFIDWDKTLSRSLFWFSLKDVDHPYHAYADRIEKTLFGENRHLLGPWMRGQYSAEDVCSVVSEKSGVPFNVVFDGLKESCSKMEFVSGEIPALLLKIRAKGVRVTVATDNMDTFLRFTVPGLGLRDLFDDFLVSSSIGFLKDETNKDAIPFFDGYLKDGGFKYNEAVLLDDHAEMADAYSQLGLEIIPITGPEALLDSLKMYAA